MTIVATRRTDRRAATVAEIKAAAWTEMRESGSSDCSLRAVARRVGMAPSALYRYFGSRDDLITDLIVDSFDDLTATLTAAYRRARSRATAESPGEVFVAVAAAYRRWALADRVRHRLIFGSPVGGYVGNDRTTIASQGSSRVLLDVMVDLVAQGALDVERLTPSISGSAGRGFERWGETLPTPLPTVALAAAIDCYASLQGAITLEVNGHLPLPLEGDEAVFLGTMRRVVAGILRVS